MSWKDSAHWKAENEARIQVARKRDWLEAAACRGLDPAIFFPERGEDEKPAKAICRTCKVRTECLIYALDSGEKFGVWGGTSERERRRLRAERRTERSGSRTPLERDHQAPHPMNEGTEHAPYQANENDDRTDDVRSEDA